ncbi:MAG: molybdenum cofactor biosynthesis protein MoaE [Pseudomonadales bacterium]
MHREVRIQTEDFVPDAEYQALRRRSAGSAGAIATFVGLVRGVSGDADAGGLQALHLEHYPGMTERSIEAIVDRAAERWPLLDVVVVHRVGALAPAAQIVYVQVASAHRAAAFAACEFIMDYLKTDAVLWKREDARGASRWIEATGDDRDRINAWDDAAR